jgi:hypothetical protein
VPSSRLASASRLNRKYDAPNVGRLNGMNGQVSDDGEDIRLKSIHQGLSVPRGLANRPLCPPVSCDLLEAGFGLTLECFGFLLLCSGLCFTFRHWVDTGREQLLRGEVEFAASLSVTTGYSPKVMFFSVPSNLYRQSQNFPAHGCTTRHSPPLSANLYFFSLGFAFSISLIVSGMAESPK